MKTWQRTRTEVGFLFPRLYTIDCITLEDGTDYEPFYVVGEHENKASLGPISSKPDSHRTHMLSWRSHGILQTHQVERHPPCTILPELCNVQQRELLTEQRPWHDKKQWLSHSKSWNQRNSHAHPQISESFSVRGPDIWSQSSKEIRHEGQCKQGWNLWSSRFYLKRFHASVTLHNVVQSCLRWGSHQHNQKWLEQSRYMCHLSKLRRVWHCQEGFCPHETIDQQWSVFT